MAVDCRRLRTKGCASRLGNNKNIISITLETYQSQKSILQDRRAKYIYFKAASHSLDLEVVFLELSRGFAVVCLCLELFFFLGLHIFPHLIDKWKNIFSVISDDFLGTSMIIEDFLVVASTLVSSSTLDEKSHIEKHFPGLPRQFSPHVLDIFFQKVHVGNLLISIPLPLSRTMILQFGNNFC